MFILEELLSPIVTPFILIFLLRNKSLEIIDFFRNFTVEVVGVGDICSFAQMDIRRHGNPTVSLVPFYLCQSDTEERLTCNEVMSVFNEFIFLFGYIYSGCQRVRQRRLYTNRLKTARQSCPSCISPLKIHTGSHHRRAQCSSAI